MKWYLIIQTFILIIASAFILKGQYESNDYPARKKYNLYIGIGQAIILIFVADLVAIACYFIMQYKIQ